MRETQEAQAQSSLFLWVGNALWLDFVNTEIVVEGRRVDLLQSDADVWTWAAQGGIPACEAQAAPDSQKASVAGAMSADAGEGAGETLLQEARHFRGQLRALAAQLAVGKAASPDSMDALNTRLAQRRGHEALARNESGYELTFNETGSGRSILFARLARSAADLLARGDAHRVRKCENPNCILYYYDNSKNHARRWCSMSGCGNRHKQQAHYQRKRQST